RRSAPRFVLEVALMSMKRMSSPSPACLEQPPSPTNPQSDLDQSIQDDNELLAGVRAGDASAATALHRRTHAVVCRTVNRLLGRRDQEAEDVAHLAFIELVKTIDNFRGNGPLDAWVRVVSSRAVYRHIRRRRLDRRLVSLVPPEAMTGTSEVTRRDLVFRDALRRIRQHLALVDEKRSLTFLLHDFYGYDMREVARLTGVSVAAAKTRLARGRREVRERAHSDPELASLARELSGAQDAP
ncbi:MAG TPA: RNA polymerase sigma factor, partial [Polyangiaceae bacterium]